jgi:hypothetical protein
MANFGGTSKSLPPPRLEHFVMTEKLGQGTYATVYKAYRKVTFGHVFTVGINKPVCCHGLFHIYILLLCFRVRPVRLWQSSVFT